MVRARDALLAAVALALLLAGCAEPLKAYERAGSEDDDVFTFSVPEGASRLRISFSTTGGTGDTGSARLVIAGPGDSVAYLGSLPPGASDRQTVERPAPGEYVAVISYEDYDGPAQITLDVARGLAIGPVDDFWDILGVVLTLALALGGFVLYRRRTRRLDQEMGRIDDTFRRLGDDVTTCRSHLLDLQEELRQQLVRNRLRESHFLILEKRIDRYLADLERPGAASPASGEKPLELE